MTTGRLRSPKFEHKRIGTLGYFCRILSWTLILGPSNCILFATDFAESRNFDVLMTYAVQQPLLLLYELAYLARVKKILKMIRRLCAGNVVYTR